MNVIPFPVREENWHTKEVVYNHLMDVAQHTLDRIADDISEVAKNKKELREQLIFVLDQLSGIAEDLKEASNAM